jgi:hypothetical protein
MCKCRMFIYQWNKIKILVCVYVIYIRVHFLSVKWSYMVVFIELFKGAESCGLDSSGSG